MTVFGAALETHYETLVEQRGTDVVYTQDITSVSLKMYIYAGARQEEAEPGVSVRGMCSRADFGSLQPTAGDRVAAGDLQYLVEDVGSLAVGGVLLRLRQEATL